MDDAIMVGITKDSSLRSRMLKLVLDDMAEEFQKVIPEKEFVVELRDEFPPLFNGSGPYYVMFDGKSACKKPIIAVSEKKEYDAKCAVSFSRAYYFIKVCPFVLDYLTEYARACKIDTIRYKKEY